MVTLEISSTDIKLMEIGGGKVVRWASRSLEAGIMEEEVVADPQAFSAAVKQLMSSSGIRERNITVSVSGLYSLSRIVVVPVPPGETVTHAAVIEAATEVMGLSEDELYIAWQAIADIEGGRQVLVVGVPRNTIDGEMGALKAAGLNPRVLTIKAMALVRAVNREQALILNIEPTSYDIVVLGGGVAEVMRTTAWQTDELSDEEKAENLAVALELTVGFYNSHHPDFPLGADTPFFITGQMSADLDLVEKLRDRVEYPFEALAPPLEYPAHLPASQYAVNIGLALRGTVASKSEEPGGFSLPDINLLPRVYLPWRPSARQIYSAVAIVAFIALLFPLYQVTAEAVGKTSSLKARYTVINSELERRQAEIKNREPLQKAISQYRTIENLGGGFIEDLKVINDQAGELGVEVGSITHAGSEISFTTQADSYLTFRAYIAALEQSGRFLNPVIPPEGYPYVKGGIIKLKPQPAQ